MWVVGPSIALTIVTGLLAMVATPGFKDAGWVWAKAATGILLLQAGLHAIAPFEKEAKGAAKALADGGGHEAATRLFTAELNTLWLLLAVSLANIALAIWRPRFPKYPV